METYFLDKTCMRCEKSVFENSPVIGYFLREMIKKGKIKKMKI